MFEALFVGLAQRACWIVMHSSCGQVIHREFFLCRAVQSKKTTFSSTLAFHGLPRKGTHEKPSGQFLGLIMMSHRFAKV
jgi:hypothetical protein